MVRGQISQILPGVELIVGPVESRFLEKSGPPMGIGRCASEGKFTMTRQQPLAPSELSAWMSMATRRRSFGGERP